VENGIVFITEAMIISPFVGFLTLLTHGSKKFGVPFAVSLWQLQIRF